MRNKYIHILLIFLISASTLFSQRLLKLSVNQNGNESEVSYILRKGKTYVSSIELAKALGANSYYNENAAKVELKFTRYNVKVTARNQFIILTEKATQKRQIYQIPISTLLLKNDVFIPIQFTTSILQKAFGGSFTYNNNKKELIVGLPASTKSTNKEKLHPYAQESHDKVLAPKPTSVSKFDIYGMQIEEKSNGTLIRLKTKSKIKMQPRSSISNNTLFLYLAGVTIDEQGLAKTKTAGLVKDFSTRIVSGNPQLQFKLKDGYSEHETFFDVENGDILVTIHNKKYVVAEKESIAEKRKWKFDVVVLDAGHGGKDPGAIGITGVREKDVNLGITLKLGKLIEKNLPGVKVVYTRKSDKFIELSQRGKIANENDGKLFISIHANSLGRKKQSIRGFDVYLLRPGRTQEAIKIAEIENSVIQYEDNPNGYQELTDENFILVSMAHSSYMRYSERFSDILFSKWQKGVGIPARGIKQAGFYVLVGASMPGALVETGYITNRKDEAYLKSSKGQQKIAQALFNSIKEYKNYYEKTFKE